MSPMLSLHSILSASYYCPPMFKSTYCRHNQHFTKDAVRLVHILLELFYYDESICITIYSWKTRTMDTSCTLKLQWPFLIIFLNLYLKWQCPTNFLLQWFHYKLKKQGSCITVMKFPHRLEWEKALSRGQHHHPTTLPSFGTLTW